MKKHFCDICQKEILKNWEDSGSLEINMAQSSGNPLARMKFSNGNFQRAEIRIPEVCWSCARKLSNAIFQALDGILYVDRSPDVRKEAAE